MISIKRPTAKTWRLDLGATVIDKEKVSFKVWAPEKENISVRMTSGGRMSSEILLEKRPQGYFTGMADGVSAGDRYLYIVDRQNPYPDPASRFQPEGVHGPSEIVDSDEFLWDDGAWEGIRLKDFIIYELHVGTFTKEGTFVSVIPRIDYLLDLGITAIELMPIAQFPGNRNWGYDGVYPFAPQNSYGGPAGLRKLINAAHKKGLAIILDVVYNHLGPEGNCLHNYGPYFTNKYRTPWGDAVNFDGPYSDEVRHFFIANALYWVNEYHVDALRLDAVQGIFDFGAVHFLRELCESVHAHAETLGREVHVIAESDLNDVRIINPPDIGGHGLDAQWNDDFHHALHVLLTGEKKGYYEDFGGIKHLAKAFREGFVYSGQFSRYRKRAHGNSSRSRPANQFVVFCQSHDQVGNRMLGDRLSRTQSLEKLKLAAGTVLLSPYIPLLFMGEEYGELAPFQYFMSHSDDALAQAVRKGRKEEFLSFMWEGEMPDPRAESTFIDSKLHMGLHEQGKHRVLFRFYKKLLMLRREIPALCQRDKEAMEVKCFEDNNVMLVRRWFQSDNILCLFSFNAEIMRIRLPLHAGTWIRMLESSSKEWAGRGELAEDRIESRNSESALSLNPYSFVLYRMFREGE